MVNLTIRNIPNEILKRIRIFAAKERRSLNSEMLMIIEDGLSSRIAGETGGTVPPGSAHAVISAAGRERIWGELCGSWEDSREFSVLRDEIYQWRSLGKKQ